MLGPRRFAPMIAGLLTFLLISGMGLQPLSAQEATAPTGGGYSSADMFQKLYILSLILSGIVAFMSISLFFILDRVMRRQSGKGLFPVLHDGFLKAAWYRFIGMTPGSLNRSRNDVPMQNHEYDGIVELDNPPPPLFNIIFYATIIFAPIYLIYYHVLDGPTQEQEYAMQIREYEQLLAQMSDRVDENTVKVLTASNDLDAGQEIFVEYCAACHGQQGEGGVGPNFADRYWIHGGTINDLFRTVRYGVPAKGMVSWEGQLSPRQIAQVSSYILTLEGTNPPNQKEPQGELFEREGDKADEPTEAAEADDVQEISQR